MLQPCTKVTDYRHAHGRRTPNTKNRGWGCCWLSRTLVQVEFVCGCVSAVMDGDALTTSVAAVPLCHPRGLHPSPSSASSIRLPPSSPPHATRNYGRGTDRDAPALLLRRSVILVASTRVHLLPPPHGRRRCRLHAPLHSPPSSGRRPFSASSRPPPWPSRLAPSAPACRAGPTGPRRRLCGAWRRSCEEGRRGREASLEDGRGLGKEQGGRGTLSPPRALLLPLIWCASQSMAAACEGEEQMREGRRRERLGGGGDIFPIV